MARSVIWLRCGISVAFGLKRTLRRIYEYTAYCDSHRLIAKIWCRHDSLRTTAARHGTAAHATRRRGGWQRATALAHPLTRGPSGSGSALADRARARQLRASACAQRAMGDDRLAARPA